MEPPRSQDIVSTSPLFVDRQQAGRLLTARLRAFRGPDVVVLGIMRGGVPVARAVADALRTDLDVLVVQRLCVPGRPDVVFGSIADGVRVINDAIAVETGLSASKFAQVEREERERLRRRRERLRDHREPVALDGRTVLVIDDGMVTGATARAACRAAYFGGALRVVLAVPIAPPRTVCALTCHADKVVCLRPPERLRSVDEGYEHAGPSTDTEVYDLLAQPKHALPAPIPCSNTAASTRY
jgi:putative phosphoribosyl transferase